MNELAISLVFVKIPWFRPPCFKIDWIELLATYYDQRNIFCGHFCEKNVPSYSHFCARGRQNGIFSPKFCLFCKWQLFGSSALGKLIFLHTFRIEMYSLAHSLFNKSIVIKISRELAWLLRHKVFIEIKKKNYFLRILCAKFCKFHYEKVSYRN